MYILIAIEILIAAVIVFIKYFFLKKYSIKRTLYWTIAVAVILLLMVYLELSYGIIFKNIFITILFSVFFAVPALYCERFFITRESDDGGHTPQTQPMSETASISPDQLEYEQWKAEIARRHILHTTVPLAEIEAVVAELTENTKRPVIWVEPIAADNLPLLTSKYGGLPYISKSDVPPCDREGRQLRLLAQLNMQELPLTDFMPKKGLLQFWALNDRMYGFASHHNNANGTYRIVYHEEIDIDVTAEQVLQKYHPWYEEGFEDHFPINQEFALRFTFGEEGMGADDSRWDKLFAEMWNQKHPEMEVYSLEDLPNARDFSEYCLYSEKNKIGGYPNFVQANRYGEEDVLLLQIPGSSWGQCRIKWGDCGIANFFIKEDALAVCDFSDVMYHWDCC